MGLIATIRVSGDVTGTHPAVLGQDFHYYLEKPPDEVEAHFAAAKVACNWGCVLTFDFHMLSRYQRRLEPSEEDKYLVYNIGEKRTDEYGEISWFEGELDRVVEVIQRIGSPIVLRLFHECNGNWFWWGRPNGGPKSYRKFFQHAVTHIRCRTDLAIFAWSPNYPFDEEAQSYYPGDEFVDIVGLDIYDIGEGGAWHPSWENFKDTLRSLVRFARAHGKVAAVTETGNRVRSPDQCPEWWIQLRDVVLECQREGAGPKIAWVLSWFNAPWHHESKGGNMIPHRHSSSEAKASFRQFASHPGVHLISQAGGQ